MLIMPQAASVEAAVQLAGQAANSKKGSAPELVSKLNEEFAGDG
jgi:hypothetical protein